MCSTGWLILLGISLPTALSAQELFRPEDIAGRWEASDGQGGEVGMNILVSTTIASSSTDVANVPHTLESFEIGVGTWFEGSSLMTNAIGGHCFVGAMDQNIM